MPTSQDTPSVRFATAELLNHTLCKPAKSGELISHDTKITRRNAVDLHMLGMHCRLTDPPPVSTQSHELPQSFGRPGERAIVKRRRASIFSGSDFAKH